MFDLSTNQIAILAAGVVLIGAGFAGLLPLLLNQGRAAGRLRIDESLNPALSAATSIIRPTQSLFATRPAVASKSAHQPKPTTAAAKAPDLVDLERGSRFGDGEIPAAEELLARLFTIRMTLSEVTEEIHTLRDAYHLDDDDIVEDIDDADDDLSDIDQDVDPKQGTAMKPARKVSEAA